MSELSPHYVEALPSDFERFIGGFFSHRGWHVEAKYDHHEGRLFLEVKLRNGKLSSDDRFLSLIAFYIRSQRLLLRQNGEHTDLQCRLLDADGHDLSSRLQGAEAYLDDAQRGNFLGRQLAWLSLRRRFVHSFLPKTLLWAGVIATLMVVMGFSLTLAVLLCLAATLVQSLLVGFLRDK